MLSLTITGAEICCSNFSIMPLAMPYLGVACGSFIFPEIIMIFTFILALSLALISFLAGGYIVKVAIYTGIAQGAVIIIVLAVAVWLYRRFIRGRRGGVPQIPPL